MKFTFNKDTVKVKEIATGELKILLTKLLAFAVAPTYRPWITP
jgi:hypothetical protein